MVVELRIRRSMADYSQVMDCRWSTLGCLLVQALGCGGVAQRTSPATESAVAGSPSGGGAGVAGVGAGAMSAGGAFGGSLITTPEGGAPSAPAVELAECRAPAGPGCASRGNYLQIQELRSDGGQIVVELDWPGGPNCGSCSPLCEVCEFSCEIQAEAVQGCGKPTVSVAARSGESGSAYLDTVSANPHYDDLEGKRWNVLSLLALNSSASAAGPELVDWDLSLTLSDGTVVRTLPVHAHFCASTTYVLHPC